MPSEKKKAGDVEKVDASLLTAKEALSPLSNSPSDTNMRAIPDKFSVGETRSSILVRSAMPSKSATLLTANVRFATAILVFLSMNLCLVVASRLTAWDLVVSRLLASFLVPFVTFFGYQWCHFYSIALTRKKRAFWLESNVLETYQPRARFMSHLFKPDPPTPRVDDRDLAKLSPSEQLIALQSQEDELKHSEKDGDRKETEKRKTFDANRKQFYENEYAAGWAAAKERASTTGDASVKSESLFDGDQGSAPSVGASTSVASTSTALSPKDAKKKDSQSKDAGKNASDSK